MIGRISGTIIHRGKGELVVEASGVGFLIYVKQATLDEIAKSKETSVALWTHHAVRENSAELYGFLHRETLEFFELLIQVSGIGPKSALAILNVAPVPALKSAIASGDATHLTKTTGIGTKKAEKIILELRDKVDSLDSEPAGHNEISDAIDALQALGYTRREAQDALRKVPHAITSTEAKIKEALKLLGK